MGYEQRIRFTGQSPATLDTILRAAPHFARHVPAYGLYEYRSDRNGDLHAMPDAYAAIEPDGIYFCDNGDAGAIASVRAYLRAVIERAGQTFEPEEL